MPCGYRQLANFKVIVRVFANAAARQSIPPMTDRHTMEKIRMRKLFWIGTLSLALAGVALGQIQSGAGVGSSQTASPTANPPATSTSATPTPTPGTVPEINPCVEGAAPTGEALSPGASSSAASPTAASNANCPPSTGTITTPGSTGSTAPGSMSTPSTGATPLPSTATPAPSTATPPPATTPTQPAMTPGTAPHH